MSFVTKEITVFLPWQNRGKLQSLGGNELVRAFLAEGKHSLYEVHDV